MCVCLSVQLNNEIHGSNEKIEEVELERQATIEMFISRLGEFSKRVDTKFIALNKDLSHTNETYASLYLLRCSRAILSLMDLK